jgi:CDP-diacylglycerol--serine O-phosphatidyltransferase
VQAMNNRFENAAIAIFVAMVLDGLDGRVARLTHTQSEFGAQYDSLSDMVSFGAAPALVMYEWALKGMGKLGWIAAFVYCVGAALRLARFNTNIDVVDKRYFQGLPSPAAAALVMGLIWVADDAGLRGVTRIDWLAWTAFAVTLYAGLTMVSNAPFYSFKDVSFRRSVPFIVIVAIALAIAVINIHPPTVLFALFVAYGVSGYAVYAWIRGLRLEAHEGPAGQRDRDVDRRARREGPAPMSAARPCYSVRMNRRLLAALLLAGAIRAG